MNQIKSDIPELIINNQTGFLKGRYIGENIGSIDNNIDYAPEKSRHIMFYRFQENL